MIAREGLPFIAGGTLITLVLLLLSARFDSRIIVSLAAVAALLTVFTTFFFRDPDRSFVSEPGIIVAPADGKVIGIEQIAEHPFIGGAATNISIFLSVFDVHINRIPATGRIDYVRYQPGKFFVAFEDKASEFNEHTEIGMTTDTGARIVFKQIAGLIARRIVCRVREGESVTAGQRFGLIRFGSRTELFVPAESRLSLHIGDYVAGGETVLGYLPRTVEEQTEVQQIRGTDGD